MKLITLNKANIYEEHICCAISDKKCAEGFQLKKDCLKAQFRHGYTFSKFDVRHKVFIEYVKAEKAWVPISAPGYMYIGCFWVAGQFKGKGLGKKLFRECMKDSSETKGISPLICNGKVTYITEEKRRVPEVPCLPRMIFSLTLV